MDACGLGLQIQRFITLLYFNEGAFKTTTMTKKKLEPLLFDASDRNLEFSNLAFSLRCLYFFLWLHEGILITHYCSESLMEFLIEGFYQLTL